MRARLGHETAPRRGWVAAAGLIPLNRLGIPAAKIVSLAEELYPEAKVPVDPDKRMAAAIGDRAAALKYDLADRNIWERVFQSFICGKKDAAAGACFLTALYSLLTESPTLAPRRGLHERYEAAARLLGEILFTFEPVVVKDVVHGRTAPALVNIVALRATSDLPSVAGALSLESGDLRFARQLMLQLYGNQRDGFPGYKSTYTDLICTLPSDLVAQIAVPRNSE
jgi:hypothetical protein